MKDALQSLKWDVFPAYESKRWLTKTGRPVVVPKKNFLSDTAVRRAWERYGGKKTGPVLGKVIDSGREHTIEPMAEVRLFKTFADLDYADTDALLAFAERYGNLRGSHLHQHQALSGGHLADGESHLQWAFEIVQMREALKLTRDRSSAVQQTKKHTITIKTEKGKVELRKWIPVIPSREADQKRLTALINSHLEQVQPRIVIGELNQMSYGSLDLLSSMWLRFALALIDHLEYRQCKNCGKSFEIGSDGHNKNREFCDSGYCRLKHYRQRKKWALRLAFSKPRPSLSNIAKETGTTTTTLKKWMKTEREKRRR